MLPPNLRLPLGLPAPAAPPAAAAAAALFSLPHSDDSDGRAPAGAQHQHARHASASISRARRAGPAIVTHARAHVGVARTRAGTAACSNKQISDLAFGGEVCLHLCRHSQKTQRRRGSDPQPSVQLADEQGLDSSLSGRGRGAHSPPRGQPHRLAFIFFGGVLVPSATQISDQREKCSAISAGGRARGLAGPLERGLSLLFCSSVHER